MPKVPLGNIQGPKGDTGDEGPQGATGVNSIWNGSAFVDQPGAKNFIADVDPGAVVDGCVWYDTS